MEVTAPQFEEVEAIDSSRTEEEESAEERKIERLVLAFQMAERQPTRGNYNRVLLLINDLPDQRAEYAERLGALEESVTAEEEQVELARAAVEKAEQEESRESIDEAKLLAGGLLVHNASLNNRLETVEIVVVENERVLAEKAEAERVAEEVRAAAEKEEAERQTAAAKKAEEARVVAEKAAAEEAERIAAEQEEKETEVYESVEVAGVWIAPQSGEKYHYDPNCRGLSNANSIVEITLEQAQLQGYDLCGWED